MGPPPPRTRPRMRGGRPWVAPPPPPVLAKRGGERSGDGRLHQGPFMASMDCDGRLVLPPMSMYYRTYAKAFLVWALVSVGGYFTIPEKWVPLVAHTVGFGFYLVITTSHTRWLLTLTAGAVMYVAILNITFTEDDVQTVSNATGVGIQVCFMIGVLWYLFVLLRRRRAAMVKAGLLAGDGELVEDADGNMFYSASWGDIDGYGQLDDGARIGHGAVVHAGVDVAGRPIVAPVFEPEDVRPPLPVDEPREEALDEDSAAPWLAMDEDVAKGADSFRAPFDADEMERSSMDSASSRDTGTTGHGASSAAGSASNVPVADSTTMLRQLLAAEQKKRLAAESLRLRADREAEQLRTRLAAVEATCERLERTARSDRDARRKAEAKLSQSHVHAQKVTIESKAQVIATERDNEETRRRVGALQQSLDDLRRESDARIHQLEAELHESKLHHAAVDAERLELERALGAADKVQRARATSDAAAAAAAAHAAALVAATAVPPLRIVRTTANLDAVTRFFRDGVGLDVQSASSSGIVFGRRDSPYLLEFSRASWLPWAAGASPLGAASSVGPPPSQQQQQQLVFNLSDADVFRAAVERLVNAGFYPMTSTSLWDTADLTKSFEDPDGNRVVLANVGSF